MRGASIIHSTAIVSIVLLLLVVLLLVLVLHPSVGREGDLGWGVFGVEASHRDSDSNT